MLFHVMLGARFGFLKSSMQVVQIRSKPRKPWHIGAYLGLFASAQILPWQTNKILTIPRSRLLLGLWDDYSIDWRMLHGNFFVVDWDLILLGPLSHTATRQLPL